MATFAEWLAKQQDFALFELATQTLIQIGQRKDLQILHISFEPGGSR